MFVRLQATRRQESNFSERIGKMKQLVSPVIILGKAVFCFPLLTRRFKASAAQPYFLKPLVYSFHFLATIFVSVFWTGLLLKDIEKRGSADIRISRLVERFLDHVPSSVSDLIIRFGSTILWTEQLEIIEYLSSPSLVPDPLFGDKVNVRVIATVFIAPLVFAVARVGVPFLELWQPLPDDFRLKWFPGTGVIVRIWVLLADFWLSAGHYYAWVFITGIGYSLLQRLRKIANMGVEGVPDGSQEAGFELKPLLNAFEKYGRVAGTYCFAFLVYFTCHVITSLSVVVYTDIEPDGMDVLDHWLSLVWAGSVVGLICFGNYISNSVRSKALAIVCGSLPSFRAFALSFQVCQQNESIILSAHVSSKYSFRLRPTD